MCNRYVWIFTLIFWLIVFLFAGWSGVGLMIAFSGAILLVVGLVERRVND